MQLTDLEHFRDVILERRQNLSQWLDSPGSARVDDAQKVRQVLGQIKEALDRIENDSYGCCDVCHDEIERHRLEVQPATQICLDCISEEEKTALEEDLYLASKIHRALLPQSMPAIQGVEVETRSLAAGSIGGDYYDFLSRTGSQTNRIIIADAMGHGLPAGLLMSNLQGALRILSEEIDSPSRLLSRLNIWLCRNVPVTKFVSLVCLSLVPRETRTTEITYTNAGHCPPILIRSDGTMERLEVNGGVLGVQDSFIYEERSVTLGSGDLLLLYTDGVIEAERPDGEQYEEKRLIEFLRAHRADASARIIDDLVICPLLFS